jgi:putative tryptophan/tyrosine transport system substrate-binding protein
VRLVGLAVVLAVSLTLATLAAEAQQAGKVYRVGVLASSSSIPDNIGNGRQAFLERLSELGWVVGQKLTFEPRSADQRLDRLPGLAAELVQLNVSMILAFGHQAALAAKRATATIPIVMLAGDPVGSGLIASLAHPGGNITGLTNEASLEILSSGWSCSRRHPRRSHALAFSRTDRIRPKLVCSMRQRRPLRRYGLRSFR